MAFVTGMMGPFMRPIPFNVPVAMLASLLVAYIVVPWAARKWLGSKANLRAFEETETFVPAEDEVSDFELIFAHKTPGRCSFVRR